MRSFSLSRRDRFYNQDDAYRLTPIYRVPVVPGQSCSLNARVKFQTAAFSKNVLSGGIASCFWFYVPNRLLWDDWTSFIAQDADGGLTFPVTSQNWNLVFDRDVTNRSALYRRAYKLVYNSFFGSEEFDDGSPETWYDDITADSVTTECEVRNAEQFTGRMMMQGAVTDPAFVTSSGTPPNDVSIALDDFYRQMMNARSARKANMSGDKYVDALRRMGVEPDWRIQNAPEFLGRTDHPMRPVKTFNTSGTGTGDSVARFEGTIESGFKRKMFAEHGYLVGVFTMRPFVYNDEMDAPMDAYATSIEDFYLADNLRSQDEYSEGLLSSASVSSVYTQRFAYLRNGIHAWGRAAQWVMNYNASDAENAAYPEGFALPVSDELTTGDYAVECEAHLQGATPVPPNSL